MGRDALAGLALPVGVRTLNLVEHGDSRGTVTELYRSGWLDVAANQWNFVRSRGGVLRGVHAHRAHSDYLVVLEGYVAVGLHDLRPDSSTSGMSAMIDLRGDQLTALAIPPGVAHGFCHVTPSLHIYAMSETWTPSDELGCQWNDPSLDLQWPIANPVISERDANLPSLERLRLSLVR